MAEPHVDQDVTEIGIRWFTGHGPAVVKGDCPHDCRHAWGVEVIAWGPDNEHYTLIQCNNPATCAGSCRGWTAEHGDGKHATYRTHGWKQVYR